MVGEPDDTTPSEDAGELGDSDAGQTPAAADAIARGVALWRRRGYAMRYQDAYLAQLVRRGGPDLVPLAAGLVVIAAVGVWWFASRSWLVVSITADPDGHLVVHRQRTRRQPPE